MVPPPELEELSATTAALIEKAWRMGYDAGVNDTRERLLSLLSTPAIEAPLNAQSPFTPEGGATEVDKGSRSKAPRGSVERIVKAALLQNPGGMTPELIVRWGENNTGILVSDGSVRNVLRKWESEGKVSRDRHLWKTHQSSFMATEPGDGNDPGEEDPRDHDLMADEARMEKAIRDAGGTV